MEEVCNIFCVVAMQKVKPFPDSVTRTSIDLLNVSTEMLTILGRMKLVVGLNIVG